MAAEQPQPQSERRTVVGDVAEKMRNVPPSSAEVRRDAEEARRAQALTLRLAGLSYEQIGDRLGISTQSVHKMLRSAMTNTIARNVEELRSLENARLDRAQSAIWTRVLEGDLRALQGFIRISQERSKLNGLYAPTQIDLAVSVRREMEQSLKTLEAMMDQMPIVDVEVIEDGEESSDFAGTSGNPPQVQAELAAGSLAESATDDPPSELSEEPAEEPRASADMIADALRFDAFSRGTSSD